MYLVSAGGETVTEIVRSEVGEVFAPVEYVDDGGVMEGIVLQEADIGETGQEKEEVEGVAAYCDVSCDDVTITSALEEDVSVNQNDTSFFND